MRLIYWNIVSCAFLWRVHCLVLIHCELWFTVGHCAVAIFMYSESALELILAYAVRFSIIFILRTCLISAPITTFLDEWHTFCLFFLLSSCIWYRTCRVLTLLPHYRLIHSNGQFISIAFGSLFCDTFHDSSFYSLSTFIQIIWLSRETVKCSAFAFRNAMFIQEWNCSWQNNQHQDQWY